MIRMFVYFGYLNLIEDKEFDVLFFMYVDENILCCVLFIL